MITAYTGAIQSPVRHFAHLKLARASVRLSDLERRNLEARAQREGVSLSELIRRALAERDGTQ